MKLVQDQEVVLGNTKSASKFTIAASAKAFKILSSSLYKNKIRAIVRELTCNAVDAHRMVNNTEPFNIQVPSKFNMQFIIRDFGPGMSDDHIQELYTTYFGSTKAESNDFIGGLGLGSKSPFSYTDIFSIKSYFGGKIRGYSAMLDNGEPVLRPTFVTDMSDSDKTGIEVIVPVKEADIKRWEDEIRYVLRPFQENYNVGIDINTFPNEKVFKLKTSHEGVNHIYAVYGNIVYPLDTVPGLEYEWLKTGQSIFFQFEMGTLDIQPSREELSLDDATIKHIQNVVNEASLNIFKQEVKQLQKIECPRKLSRTLDNLTFIQQTLLDTLEIKFTDQNLTRTELKEALAPSGKLSDLSRTVSAYRVMANPKRLTLLTQLNTNKLRANQLLFAHSVRPNIEKVHIVLNDSKGAITGFIRGLNQYICEVIDYNGQDEVKSGTLTKKEIPTEFPARGDVVYVLQSKNPDHIAFLDGLKTHMGQDEVIVLKTSEYGYLRDEDPLKGANKDKQNYYRPSNNVNVVEYNLEEKYYSGTERYCSAKDLDNLTGPCIVQIRHAYYTFDGEMVHIDLDQIKNMAKLAGLNKFNIVRNNTVQRLLKSNKTFDMTKTLFDAYIKTLNEMEINEIAYKNNSRFYDNIHRVDFLHIKQHIYGVSDFTKYNLVKKIKDTSLAPNRSYADHTAYENALKDWNKKRDESIKLVKEKIDNFKKNYPLIAMAMDSFYSFNDDVTNNIVQLTKDLV